MSLRYEPPTQTDSIAQSLFGFAGKWVVITNDLILPKPDAIKVHGTHVVAFVYIDHTAGIRARLDYCCVFSSDGYPRITRTIFVDDKTIWFIRYETLRDFTMRLASNEECRAMSLPEFPISHPVTEPQLARLRQIKELDPFRAAGYPDDVAICIAYDRVDEATFQEVIWGRLERQVDTDTFECILLNKPVHTSGLSVGGRIEVSLLKLPHVHKLVWKAHIDGN